MIDGRPGPAAVVPLLTFMSLLLVVVQIRPEWGWRRSALRTALLFGAYALGVVELLSIATRVSRGGLMVAWLIPLGVAVGTLGIRLLRRMRVPSSGRQDRPSALEGFLLVGMFVILALTGVTAWYAPPQTWDSLNYHMARVAHWASQSSVRHFATGIEIQNSQLPAAEYMVLHTYLLAGNDRLANFVQWAAMVLSLAGVSLLAEQLGATRRGQFAASFFVATLPMGIVQASSTMTDYLLGLWVLAATSEALTIRQEGPARANLAFLGLATGLALATKGTAAAGLLPLGAYSAYQLLRWRHSPVGLGRVAVALGLAGMLNAGFVARNVQTYGAPINPSQIMLQANELRDPRGVSSNLMRHIGLQAGTPWPHVNKGLNLVVQWLHRLMDLDVNDPRTTIHGDFAVRPPTTNEDRAANPLHTYLIFTLLAYAAVRYRTVTRPESILIFLLAGSLLAFSLLFKWQPFAARYHLPFFILAGPLAGSFSDRVIRGRWIAVLAGILLVGATPWLFQIKSRPLIAAPGRTYVGSILETPRQDLYLANGPNLRDPYLTLTGLLKESGCQRVAISLFGNAAEYPLWAFLGAPSSGIEIRWIVSGTPSARYEDPRFMPCGVICEGCPEGLDQIRGLPLVEVRADFRLFMDTSTGTAASHSHGRGSLTEQIAPVG